VAALFFKRRKPWLPLVGRKLHGSSPCIQASPYEHKYLAVNLFDSTAASYWRVLSSWLPNIAHDLQARELLQ
jgi:hypothetical protein